MIRFKCNYEFIDYWVIVNVFSLDLNYLVSKIVCLIIKLWVE